MFSEIRKINKTVTHTNNDWRSRTKVSGAGARRGNDSILLLCIRNKICKLGRETSDIEQFALRLSIVGSDLADFHARNIPCLVRCCCVGKIINLFDYRSKTVNPENDNAPKRIDKYVY